MRRYLVFAGSTYYPSGGWEDFVEHLDREDEAVKLAQFQIGRVGVDWAHVVDTQHPAKIVWDSYDGGAAS